MNGDPEACAWNPEQYEAYADERARPAEDLMARIPLEHAGSVIDLGCGVGGQAAQLAARYPAAKVLGIDSSPEMLAKACSRHGEGESLRWQEADIASFQPDGPVDLIFSNAALHWVADHAALFPRMVSWLRPGGILAVQMPNNFDAPSHRLLQAVAGARPWAARLDGGLAQSEALKPGVYYDYLAPLAQHVDIWETTYTHVLSGPDPVAEWTRSTALRPYLAALDNEQEREAFYDDYARRLREVYPPQPDGRTLFPFRRLFILAEV